MALLLSPLPVPLAGWHPVYLGLVTPALVARTVQALTEPWAAVAPALPVVDTLKLADTEGRVVRTVERRGLWAVQTPQVFPRDVLVRAHARVDQAEGATDDLVLVERAGGRVRLIEGERLNLKVTYPDDLELVAAVLAARGPP
jgi:2-C-methyl-D-erythritol 4-phosphate cytidylyltransferase